MSTQTLQGKTLLITGASRGIGLAVLAVTPRFVAETPRLPGRFDLAGALAGTAPEIAEHCVLLALGDPAVAANFVELRRVTSELADVDTVVLVTPRAAAISRVETWPLARSSAFQSTRT